ncbi:hypothetical protein HY091_01515 [Candidatus Kaiserbacteria bacterium]|nr:hypothetical protein [Candidatus Kaiserbacteria bacterium]
MKRFSSFTPLALALCFIAAGAFAPAAFAADTISCEAGFTLSNGVCVATNVGANGVNCPGGSTNADGTCTTPLSSGLTGGAGGGTTDPAAAATPTSLNTTTLADKDTSYDAIMSRIMGLFAWLLGVAAITLDNAMYYTVVTMGNYVNHLSAIGTAWRILRDVGNIVLIFGFLAIGITTILNVDWYGGGKKMLPVLLVAAIFLNFSLFISEAVIDAGNLFATEFYTQINGGSPATPVDYNLTNIHNEGISNKIMAQLGLQTIYNAGLDQNKKIFTAGNMWFVGFFAVLLFLIAAFVMFSLAFILIARFVALLFLIVVAPIGFAGLAIPKLKGTANSWWSALFEQTITAPVLLLLLYIALAVITDVQFLTGFGVGGTGSAASNSTANAWVSWINGGQGVGALASMILSFLVAMGLLLAVTIVAKKMSAFGASWATGTASKVVGGFTGYGVLGGASLLGRGTLGLGGRLLNTKRMQARASKGGWRGALAKAAAFTGRNLESRTYDLRNVKTAGKLGGAIAGVAGLAGLGGSGFEKVAGSLGKGATVSVRGATEAVEKAWKTISPLHGFEGTWWRDQQKKYEAAAAELARKKDLSVPGSTDFIKAIKKMSVDELAELRGIRQGLDTFVEVLSPAKYAELRKSDKLLQGEKDKIKRTWESQFTDPVKAKATIARFSTEEVAALDGETLTKNPYVIEALGATELEAIRRKGSLKLDQRREVYDHMMKTPALEKDFLNYLAADPTGGRERYWDVDKKLSP